MKTLFHILSYKVKIFFKTTTQLNPTSIAKVVSTMVVFGGFAVAAYLFTFSAIEYILNTARLGQFLLHRFVSMLLYVFFLSINVGNIIVSYATLYRSKETAYLLTKPVSHTHLFIIKFLDNFFYSSGTLFMIALAVMFGYGKYFHLGLLSYLQILFLLFLPFMLLSAAIGVIALLFLMRLAHKVGPRVMFGALIIGYLSSVTAYFKVTNPAALVNGVLKYFPNTNRYFGFLDAPATRYLPNHWFSEALYWSLQGDASKVLLNTGILCGVCIAFLVIMVLVARKIYYASWISYLEMKAVSESSATAKGFMSFTRSRWFESQLSVLLKKEFWQFFREPSQWIHLGIIAMLIFIFVASISKLELGTNLPYLQTVSYLVIYVFNAFLITSIALRFVYPMMSSEGLSFWKVRSAPIAINKVYWLKFLIVIIPILIAGEILSLASQAGVARFKLIAFTGLTTAIFVTLSIVSLNLGAGTFFADYRETNPIRISSSQGATITFLIGVVYMVFLVVALFFPMFLYFQMVFKHADFSLTSYFLGTGAFVIGSILIIIVSNIIGLRSIKRDF